jgi:hypothetical protein
MANEAVTIAVSLFWGILLVVVFYLSSDLSGYTVVKIPDVLVANLNTIHDEKTGLCYKLGPCLALTHQT